MGQILECYVTGISTLKDGSLKVALNTQELDSDQMTRLFTMRNKLIKAYLSDANIISEVMTEVDNLEIEETGNKSPSQRLRSCLYRLWEQSPNGFDSFTLYYDDRMERIINQIKDKLG